MSCKHGNWAPCEQCEEEAAIYESGKASAQAELLHLRKLLQRAAKFPENLQGNTQLRAEVIIAVGPEETWEV